MEDFSSYPAEKNSAPKEGDSKEQANEFVSAWERLLGLESTTLDEEDSDEEDGEVSASPWQRFKKRFSKLFKQKFPIEHTIEPIQTTEQTSIEKEKKESQINNSEIPLSGSQIGEEIATDSQERPEPQPISGAQMLPENRPMQPSEISADKENRPEHASQMPAYTEGSSVPLPAQEVIVNLTRQPETGDFKGATLEPKESSLLHSHKEPLGAAAAIGTVLVDQLSRRRDRKLRREHKSDMQAIKKELDNGVMPNTSLETAKTGQAPEPEPAKNLETGKFVNKAQLESTVQSNIKKQNSLETAKEVVEKSTKEGQAAFKPETLVKPLSPEDIPPEVVLEQVEAAAEKDIPIEAVFEKRHEIKDEPDEKDKRSDTSLNNIGQLSEQIANLAKTTAQMSKLQSHKPAKSEAKSPKSMYAQAVTSGFWTALVILAFLGVLLLIN